MGHVGHGQFTDGSDGSCVTKCDPSSAPIVGLTETKKS